VSLSLKRPEAGGEDGDGHGADQVNDVRAMSPERRARLAWTITRTKKAQAELDEFLKEYVRRDEMERGRVERIEALKAGLRAMINTLSPKLLGLRSIEEIEGVLESNFRLLCNRFAGQADTK
jgi:hypothetical protein